jgi:cytochrome c-type protein NapC
MMSETKPGVFRRLWEFLKKPSAKYSILAISSVGFVSGIIFWGGFNTGLEMTNSLEFCISCHEMRDNVYQEYKETIHYTNRTGVRAICSDCHVPKDWTHKMIRKSKASFEVWGKLTGVIDTKEKFEAERIKLATHEWQRMKDSNSRECRNCHSFEAMSPELQKQTPYKKHMKAKEDGKTCIDCHKGIAHHLPKEYEDPDE